MLIRTVASGPTADIRNFPVPQLVAPGETAPRAMLPSFLYLPGEHELPPGAARLPWSDQAEPIVGEFARFQGAKVPGPQRLERQELALSSRDRPRSRHPALGQPARGEESLAGRGLGRLSCVTFEMHGTTRSPAKTRRCVSSSRKWC